MKGQQKNGTLYRDEEYRRGDFFLELILHIEQ